MNDLTLHLTIGRAATSVLLPEEVTIRRGGGPCRSTTGPASMPGYFTITTRTGRSRSAARSTAGLLPAEYIAMTDQRVDGPEPDVITVRGRRPDGPRADLPWPTPPPCPKVARVQSDACDLRPKGLPDRRPPSTRSGRRGHRGRIAGEQGQPPRDQGVHGEAHRFPPERYQSRGHRPVSPHATRPRGDPPGDLG